MKSKNQTTSTRIKLASAGPELSRITHGLWRLKDWGKGPAEIQEMIHAALSLGVTTFDHADIYGDYGCEALFGQALAASSIAREDIELVTKCGIKLVSEHRSDHTINHYETTATHILTCVDQSLKKLRTDYIDLLLIHRPDPLMRATEVAEAFARLKETGKVRYFGVSNFLPGQFELLAETVDVPLVTNQIEYSVMDMEAQADGTLDLCQRRGIHPMAWSPLAGGRLFNEETEQAVRLRQKLTEIADQVEAKSIDQVALAWILHHPADFVIVVGTGKLSRLKAAVEAEKLELTRQHWFALWKASTGHDVP